jgi:carbamoyl-phosphate synthase large subunit
MLNLLVLGVGGNVSQGILKALAASQLSCRVIGACVSPLAVGLFNVNKAYISPKANAPEFLEWLFKICRTEGIHAILSGVEPVLDVLSQYADEIQRETGALCLVSKPSCLAIGGDKLLTCQWLESQGLNFPKYAASEDQLATSKLVEECGYPLIAKPRIGKSSQGLIKIRNSKDLEHLSSLTGYVIQEYLGDSDSEYTIGCFSDQDGDVRGAITMRRGLLQGTTYCAEVGEFPSVRREAIRIASALRPMGPSNIQLRVSNGHPVCFEINIRFSGTTPMRARLGFNDVEVALRHYVLNEPIEDLKLITQGIILRYWNEMYINSQAYDALRQTGKLDLPKDFDVFIENYGMIQ